MPASSPRQLRVTWVWCFGESPSASYNRKHALPELRCPSSLHPGFRISVSMATRVSTSPRGRCSLLEERWSLVADLSEEARVDVSTETWWEFVYKAVQRPNLTISFWTLIASNQNQTLPPHMAFRNALVNLTDLINSTTFSFAQNSSVWADETLTATLPQDQHKDSSLPAQSRWNWEWSLV